ncbi:hypothetical protein N9N67_02815 [Bacteriovoracaceae bacterium]|nr:hypothetical protein [Bacteriovoracaceae bacterium]
MKVLFFLIFSSLILPNLLLADKSFTKNLDIDSINWTVNKNPWAYQESESRNRFLSLDQFQSEYVKNDNLETGIIRCSVSRLKNPNNKKAAWVELNFNRGLLAIKFYKDKEIYYGQFNKVYKYSTDRGYWPQLGRRQNVNSNVFVAYAYTVSNEKYLRFIGSFLGVQNISNEDFDKIKANDMDYTIVTEKSTSTVSTNLNYCKHI